MDFYLSVNHITERLINEWNRYGKIVIAYDFDNTVYDYHKEGHQYNDVIQLLRDCHEYGAFLMVYTARRDDELDFLHEYLINHNIPFDSINEPPDFLPFNQGKKLYYNVLLDDRAGLPSAYRCLKEALEHIKSI